MVYTPAVVIDLLGFEISRPEIPEIARPEIPVPRFPLPYKPWLEVIPAYEPLCEYGGPGTVAEETNRLFVGNIPFRMTQDELYELFAQAGVVASVHIPTDRESGRPRGFGFVQMEDDNAKEQAVQMFNGYSVNGRALVVNEARPRETRF